LGRSPSTAVAGEEKQIHPRDAFLFAPELCKWLSPMACRKLEAARRQAHPAIPRHTFRCCHQKPHTPRFKDRLEKRSSIDSTIKSDAEVLFAVLLELCCQETTAESKLQCSTEGFRTIPSPRNGASVEVQTICRLACVWLGQIMREEGIWDNA
jgi:hypothetical protein